MARGKNTCRILKDIRRQIAEANDIEFVTSECRYQGDCLGTCPKCEAEVRYLEQQLRARSLAGKAVALAGISAGLIFMPSCSSSASDSSNNDYDENYVVDVSEDDNIDFGETIEGDVEIPIPGEVTLVIDRDEYWVSDSAEIKPKYPGGLDALEHFINERYSKDNVATGSCIYIYFTIDQYGKVVDISSTGYKSLEQQLIRIAKQFPDFTPAEKDGKQVPIGVSIFLVMTDDGIKIDQIGYSLKNDKER